MRELEYPFDPEQIIKRKKRIKKELLSADRAYIKKNVAILGGGTTDDIKNILELFLLNYGIQPQFYESEYNQYYQDAMFENPVLEEFRPDIIYICTSFRNLTALPQIQDTEEKVAELVRAEKDRFEGMWQRLERVYRCPVIQNNFEYPFYRLLGNMDGSDIHGYAHYVKRMNHEFDLYAQRHDNFFICDINYISASYGLDKWSDPFYWHMYKYALCVPAIPYLSFNVANIIKSIFGKNKKGIVLDLDNTLWGGVIGDDGVEHIAIGPEEAEGQAFSEFQRYLKQHKQLGIVLNVNSKNDYENAIAGFRHPNSILNEDDFIVIKANWETKDKNFREIADALNLLPESLVFVDDNPAERAIVAGTFPGVSAPEIDKPEQYIRILDKSGFFESTGISGDDLKRNEMYKENAERVKLQASFENYRDYLLSLEMRGRIRAFEPMYLSRIAQLTNKSNQFNLTTRRYTAEQIEEIAENGDYITLYGKLEDRFGDNGVVSVVIGRVVGAECHIDLWLMSCRVLKRDMEFAMMDSLVEECGRRGVRSLRGYYYPTAKNKMVKDFYAGQGFTKLSEDQDGNSVWGFEINGSYLKKNNVIKMED